MRLVTAWCRGKLCCAEPFLAVGGVVGVQLAASPAGCNGGGLSPETSTIKHPNPDAEETGNSLQGEREKLEVRACLREWERPAWYQR